MLSKNDRDRRRSLWSDMDASTLRKVQSFVKEEEEKDSQPAMKMRNGDGLTPKQRVLRGVRAWMFISRLSKAAKQKYSVDDVMLEVSEAIAEHWKKIRVHYGAIVMGYLSCLFGWAAWGLVPS